VRAFAPAAYPNDPANAEFAIRQDHFALAGFSHLIQMS
jgi:hypothetical protein